MSTSNIDLMFGLVNSPQLNPEVSGKYPLSGQNLKHIHCWILQQLHSLFEFKKVNGQ